MVFTVESMVFKELTQHAMRYLMVHKMFSKFFCTLFLVDTFPRYFMVERYRSEGGYKRTSKH